MASTSVLSTETSNLQFFRACLIVMSIILVAGFVSNVALGRSSFDAPPLVHVHAVTFMGWVGIVVFQAVFAQSLRLGLHRQLGRLAVVYSIALLVIGPLVTVANVQTARTPFFFQPQHLLIADVAILITFFGLFSAAVSLRKQTDWHVRLQVGAFTALMGPGLGRLLPMPFLTPYAFEAATLAGLIVPMVGIARDVSARGRPHPAWWWSIGALLAALAIARLIAFSPMGEALYALATAGSPMAGSDGLAFPASPPGALR